MTAPALLTSDWEHWTTPAEVVERLGRLGPVGLDPCSNVASVVPAALEFWGTLEMHGQSARDGLAKAAKKAERVVTAAELDEAARTARQSVRASFAAAAAEDRKVRLEDGLAADWSELAAGRLVYVNPPYGRVIGGWIRKCSLEAGRGAEIVALVPARVDAAWFQDGVFETAQRVCFWRGRLQFGNPQPGKPQNGSTFPSALVYWGRRAARFKSAFLGAGSVFDVAGAKQAELEVA